MEKDQSNQVIDMLRVIQKELIILRIIAVTFASAFVGTLIGFAVYLFVF